MRCSHHWRTAIDIVLFASMRSLPCATFVRLMGTLWGVMYRGCYPMGGNVQGVLPYGG